MSNIDSWKRNTHPGVTEFVDSRLRYIVGGAHKMLSMNGVDPEVTELTELKGIRGIDYSLIRLAFKVPPPDIPGIVSWPKAELLFVAPAGRKEIKMYSSVSGPGPSGRYEMKHELNMDTPNESDIERAIKEAIQSLGVSSFEL